MPVDNSEGMDEWQVVWLQPKRPRFDSEFPLQLLDYTTLKGLK